MKKRALITGITGQDGSYLAEFLLEKGYEVYALERRVSTKNRINIKHIGNNNFFTTVRFGVKLNESKFRLLLITKINPLILLVSFKWKYFIRSKEEL